MSYRNKVGVALLFLKQSTDGNVTVTLGIIVILFFTTTFVLRSQNSDLQFTFKKSQVIPSSKNTIPQILNQCKVFYRMGDSICMKGGLPSSHDICYASIPCKFAKRNKALPVWTQRQHK